jgi:hypothetical protein
MAGGARAERFRGDEQMNKRKSLYYVAAIGKQHFMANTLTDARLIVRAARGTPAGVCTVRVERVRADGTFGGAKRRVLFDGDIDNAVRFWFTDGRVPSATMVSFSTDRRRNRDERRAGDRAVAR